VDSLLCRPADRGSPCRARHARRVARRAACGETCSALPPRPAPAQHLLLDGRL